MNFRSHQASACTYFAHFICLLPRQSAPGSPRMTTSVLLTVLLSLLTVLIGNKADLEDQKQVDENEARTLAENLGLKYFETSALSGHNVSESVEALLDQVRRSSGSAGLEIISEKSLMMTGQVHFSSVTYRF